MPWHSLSSGLDDLERRGRWGRAAAQASARPDPPPPAPPAPSPRVQPTATPTPTPTPKRRTTNRRAPAGRVTPARQEPREGVERVVIYLSKEQTAWIRERQIEALWAGKRVSASKLLRDLMDRVMS